MTKELLQEKRREKSISQEELARICNISVSSVRNWEQGRQDPDRMSLETFKKICFYLDIKIEEGL